MNKLSTNQKIDLIKTFADEIVTEEELKELLEKKKKIVAYDGFEPSGKIHIAQGLMRAITVNKLTSIGFKFKFWVADFFALLNNKMGGDINKIRKVGEYFIEVWKASGMDLDNVEFIWTSEFIKKNPEYWESVLKLSMNASVQRVLRCGQIMGREENTNNPSAQILYPLMQAADIKHLQVDVAQLGMDQRKVNMLARDLFPKLGWKPPVAIHHHMLLGLQHKESDKEGVDRKIELKMSKSNPDSAVFMTDTEEEIRRKIKKAYCPEGVEEDNPILEYIKYVIFEKLDEFKINRLEKFGGNLKFNNYQTLKNSYIKKEIHPLDLKDATAFYINQLLEPIRKHFSKGNAKKLKDEVESYEVTR